MIGQALTKICFSEVATAEILKLQIARLKITNNSPRYSSSLLQSPTMSYYFHSSFKQKNFVHYPKYCTKCPIESPIKGTKSNLYEIG